MKKILFFIFITFSANAQQNKKLTVLVVNNYDSNMDRTNETKLKTKPNQFLIDFTEGFENDSLIVLLNNKVLLQRRLTTGISNSFALRVSYHYRKKKNPYLIIKDIKSESQIEFPIDTKFKLMKVFRIETEDQIEWHIRYTNYFPNYI